MKINKESQQIEKWEISILMNAEDFFWCYPRMKKIKRTKMWKIDCDRYPKYIFCKTPVYLRGKYILVQMMRALLSNNNGILHFWKINNSIASKLCANLINNPLKIKLCLVNNTIQWLNCVVHYLNLKINE